MKSNLTQFLGAVDTGNRETPAQCLKRICTPSPDRPAIVEQPAPELVKERARKAKAAARAAKGAGI